MFDSHNAHITNGVDIVDDEASDDEAVSILVNFLFAVIFLRESLLS